MASILTFCKKQKAELLIMVSSGLTVKDVMDEETYEEYGKYFVTDVIFNSNLRAKDVGLKPGQISKLERFRRLGNKKYSLIVPSTKQMYSPIPQKQGKFPHIITSTGTISHIDYPRTSTGILAEQDHTIGGLVVEVVNDKYFHIRHIQSDEDGGFHDLDKYYHLTSIVKIPVEAIASEPHFGSEDWTALNATKEIIKFTKCKRLFLHDMVDFKSINHHEWERVLDRHERKSHQKTLKAELDYAGEKLIEMLKGLSTKMEVMVVESNHDYFLRRWLNKGNYVKDEFNDELGHELALYAVQGKNPIEEYLKRNFPKLKKLKFLDWRGYELNDVEWGMHGHKGTNGGRGSANSLELYCDKSVSGHSHAPSIMRGVFITGCDCELIQFYNKGGGSSWIHANVIQHANGTRQLIIKINGQWRMVA